MKQHIFGRSNKSGWMYTYQLILIGSRFGFDTAESLALERSSCLKIHILKLIMQLIFRHFQ